MFRARHLGLANCRYFCISLVIVIITSDATSSGRDNAFMALVKPDVAGALVRVARSPCCMTGIKPQEYGEYGLDDSDVRRVVKRIGA